VEEANAQKSGSAAKDVVFELVAHDDQADPKVAPRSTQKLVDAKVAVRRRALNFRGHHTRFGDLQRRNRRSR